MVVSLSSSLSLYNTISSPPSAYYYASKPHQFKTLLSITVTSSSSLRHHTTTNNNNNNLLLKGISLSNSSRFTPSLAYQNFTPSPGYNSPRDARTPEKSAETVQNPSLKSLFSLYKEAVLYRDLETISKVEALISSFENEKTELLQKVSDISAELSSGKEKYLRLQADFENFRKRSEKERLKVRSDAQGEMLESLLPMVDSFERAKQVIKPQTEREVKIDTSYQGIYKQFVEIMRSLRVSVVPTVGKPFDPSMHEAIAREESHEFKDGIVIQELRRGFLLGSRLLRPAMVKVSSGPGNIKVVEKSTAAAVGLDER